MDIGGRLEQLEELIREAKSMPLSSSVLINRDEVLEMIEEMRKVLPEEIKQARWIVRDRDEPRGTGSSSRPARSSSGWRARRRS